MTDLQTAAPAGAAELSLSISASAARRIAELKAADGRDDLMLRVAVSGGGCAGFQYGFDFDDTVAEDDCVFERDGVQVVIDEMSLAMLNNAEVDYIEELVGSYFAIKNPNATSSCGCGVSFAI